MFRVEDAAAGEAHNVVQKPQRSLNRAVLVIDVRVAVAGVAAMNEVTCRLVVRRDPAGEPQVRGQLWQGFIGPANQAVCRHQFARVRQIGFKEQPAMRAEAVLGKRRLQAFAVQQQLRFDAVDAGRVLQHGQQMVQQQHFQFRGVTAGREDVADHRLLHFIHGEAVAADHSGGALERDEAG